MLWGCGWCRNASGVGRGAETDLSYSRLTELASEAPAFGPLIEPDHIDFLAPDDMTEAITTFCIRTGQRPPQTPGAMVRCCLESLALKYRWVIERLESFRGAAIDTIHIVGGGTQNRLLCRLTADATGRTAIAGPVEATALGNVLMQALGRGHIHTLDQAREVVRRSFELETYEPTSNRDAWEEAYARLLRLNEGAGTTI